MTPPRRILVDLERTRYPHSGLGYYCHCLELGLRTLQIPLELHYYRPRRAEEVDVHPYHFMHKVINRTPRGYDLLHLTHQQQDYFPGRYGERRMVTLHDLNFLYEPLSPRRYERELSKARRNLNGADCIVSISHFAQETLLKHQELFDLKPSISLEVIHNGILLSTEPPSSLGAAEASIQSLGQRPYLLSIGVLSPKKQQHLLVQMLPHLPRELELVLVYSASRAEYLGQLRETIHRLGLEARVHLLHRVSSEAKAYLLGHCQMLLHPSLAEGFGIPPVEAMAMGRPVLLNPATSLPEIGGEAAYYFSSLEPEAMAERVSEALGDFAEDPLRAQLLRLWAERYDYRRMAEDYARLYARELGM